MSLWRILRERAADELIRDDLEGGKGGVEKEGYGG